MISRDQLPNDNAELRHLNVAFPYLDPDSPESCPEPIDSVIEYLRMESADGEDAPAEPLAFIRTAQVAETRYWIWRFHEKDGAECFVTVAVSGTGISCIGYDQNYYSLTAEQFILGDYYNVF